MSKAMTKTRLILALLALCLAAPAVADEDPCAPLVFEGTPFTACRFDPARDDIRLYRLTPQGDPIGTFTRLDRMLADSGRHLSFAMNAGMYHPDRAPVGLYIESGREQAPLVTSDGPGNFGLLPNGVFCLTDGAAQVVETRAFATAPPACRDATQSGPMLVVDGALHPRFLPDSSTSYIRNGVGVTAAGEVIFAISERPVTFHQFGRLFRDMLKTPNALYLDGKVSRLYAPNLDRHDIGLPLGPLVAVSRPDTR